MKIEDVIRELRVNPDKVFESKISETIIKFDTFNCIVFKTSGNVVQLNNSLLNADWEEVKKPVTFMEAVNSGYIYTDNVLLTNMLKQFQDDGLDDYLSDVVSEYKLKGNLDPSDMMYMISHLFGLNDFRIIIKGKWYIE